ncbi:50S ribosomal protein L25 [Blattabacterium cuenoti]|uniref:50S ribosomal protein L25 n=1 Tax=Blattabacterium cuenoti TaxID=1653831 RepID=UPI00163BBC4D|nr:50S ribosomal protein L25 [Blattabacterium cuenoti]
MKYVNINGKKRNIGKKYLKSIRLSGKVPCILYGKNMNIPFSVSLESFKEFIYTNEVYWVILQIEGEKESIKSIKKEIQFDPINEKIIHADFFEVKENKSITLDIPIKTYGRPIGVSKGGIYSSPIRKLKINALPSFFPEYIKLNIQFLDIGDKITVKDLLGEVKDYKILHPTNTLLAKVKNSRLSSTTSTEITDNDTRSLKEENKEEKKETKKK